MPNWFERIKFLRNDYADVFGTDPGKRVLRDLTKRFHLLSPVENEVQEGQRQVVLHILSQMRMTDDDIRFMVLNEPLMEPDND